MKNRYKSLWLAFAVLLLVPCLRAQEEETAVLPQDLENEEHQNWSQLPFNYPDRSRLQIAVPSEQIVNVMPLGGTITAVAFRLDGPNGSPNFPPGGSLDTVIPDFELRVSTAASETLSVTFSENIGPNETIAFPRGGLALISAWDPEGPNEFSLRVPFENEFLYNPHDGDLLLDFFIYDQAGQRVVVEFGGGGGLLTGEIGVPEGHLGAAIPAMQLSFRPVPEPGTMILLVSGVLAFFLFRRNR